MDKANVVYMICTIYLVYKKYMVYDVSVALKRRYNPVRGK